MALAYNVPPVLLDLNQKGLLERAFADGLFPNLAYRSEALPEEWPANTGTEIVMSRPGPIKPKVVALTPGADPVPAQLQFEQWVATLNQYADSIDVSMVNSATGNADLFLRSIHQLGMQAGQSVNRIARNEIFKSYLSGRTALKVATASGDTSLSVGSLNGFTDVLLPSLSARPQLVAPITPLPITIGTGGAAITRNVIGAIPDDPSDPIGPGTLLLSSTVGAVFALRSPVISSAAPRQVMSSSGTTIESIGSTDTLTLQMIINAVAVLRRANVQPHDDGFYHAHISPSSEAQIFSDPVFQRLNQSLPEGVTYSTGFLGHISGVMFFMNAESPETINSGNQTTTSGSAIYANEIAAETVNGAGVAIGRVLITGKGSFYEKYLDESAYVSEAGVTGKIGEFAVVNDGLQIMTDRIRLIMRAPIDRMQQKVSLSWSISTSFPVPSDITAPSGPERFKRAVVLNHAL